MIKVGLTGGIASGKSVVADMFQEKGAFIIDADKVAHEVIEPNEPAWEEIVKHFGKDILNPAGKIDRVKLAAKVFNDKKSLKKLNSIVHPRVAERFSVILSELKKKSKPPEVIVYDVPLLIEAEMHKMVDTVVLVYVSTEKQIERLQNRNGFSLKEAEERLAAQMPLEEKKTFADYIINNECTLSETQKQVDEFWSVIPLIANKKEEKSKGEEL